MGNPGYGWLQLSAKCHRWLQAGTLVAVNEQGEINMMMVCGEALLDVFAAGETRDRKSVV